MVTSPSQIGNVDSRRVCNRAWLRFAFAGATLALLAGCHKQANELPKQTTEVTVMTVTQRDTPVEFEFTAQTQSSREVEIRARVEKIDGRPASDTLMATVTITTLAWDDEAAPAPGTPRRLSSWKR